MSNLLEKTWPGCCEGKSCPAKLMELTEYEVVQHGWIKDSKFIKKEPHKVIKDRNTIQEAQSQSKTEAVESDTSKPNTATINLVISKICYQRLS